VEEMHVWVAIPTPDPTTGNAAQRRTTPSAKDVLITLCKGCHETEH